MASAEYSPDGEQVAISCNCPGGEGVWVVSVRDSSSRLIHGDREMLPLGWSADGRWVYARRPDSKTIVRIPSRGGPPEPMVDIPFERVGDVHVTADATRIACVVPVARSDIWLIENFDPETSGTP